MPLLTTGAGKFPAIAGGGSFTLTYQDAKSAAAGSSPVSYTGFTLAGGASRVVVAINFIGNSLGTSVTAVTVNGVSCTQISGALANADPAASADVWISNTAVSGGTINVDVSYSTATGWFTAVALYNLTTSTLTSTATGKDEPFGATSTTVGPVTIPSGGAGVVVASNGGGTVMSISSGNAVLDATVSAGGNNYHFGHTTATGSQSVTFTWTGSSLAAASFAAWGP